MNDRRIAEDIQEGRVLDFPVWPMPIERPLSARELVDRARAGSVWLYVESYKDVDEEGVSSSYSALSQDGLLAFMPVTATSLRSPPEAGLGDGCTDTAVLCTEIAGA